MNIIVRNMGYGQLLSKLGNKRVLIWTCTTCARFCANIGGTDSMQMLSEQLRKAGVDVVGICSTNAGCVEGHVRNRLDMDLVNRCDIILCVMCCAGEAVLKTVTTKEVLNPTDTIGFGYMLSDGSVYLNNGTKMNGTSPMFGPFLEE